jgi:virginiamycin B lyase
MFNKKLVFLLTGGFIAACVLILFASSNMKSAEAPALSGIVSSDAEGPMEGVLVKAKRVGGTITVTVVSDEHGRYSFPPDRLQPGPYNLTIRATGYDLPNKSTPVTVANNTVADLKLSKAGASALVDQLMPAEVAMSIPGTPAQRRSIGFCVSCHSFSRVLKSTHDAEEFTSVILRMRNREPAADYTHPIDLPYHVDLQPGDEELAKYLASINLSSKSQWDFEFKTLPRPRGKATKVIYTEYDLPRRDAEPHDAVMDSEGMIWYIDFAEPFVGRLNPRTGETKEWTLPEFKPGFAPGSLGLALDKEGNPWIARSFQGGIAKFDRKTEKVTSYPILKEYDNVHTRTSFIAISPVDGKVWFDDTFNRMMYIFDPSTSKMIGYPAYPGWKWDNDSGAGRSGVGPNGEKEDHFMYGVAVSSKGMGYWGDLANTNIGEMDPETGKTKLYPTPTPNSGPRRMHIAPDDQLWFAENNDSARKIGMFDTKTKQFKEWIPPTPGDLPYDVVPDKAGFVWAGGERTDFVTRLNPKTGEMVDYVLPNSNVNIRRVDVNNFTNPPSMLLGENHQAKIVLVQPLD